MSKKWDSIFQFSDLEIKYVEKLIFSIPYYSPMNGLPEKNLKFWGNILSVCQPSVWPFFGNLCSKTSKKAVIQNLAAPLTSLSIAAPRLGITGLWLFLPQLQKLRRQMFFCPVKKIPLQNYWLIKFIHIEFIHSSSLSFMAHMHKFGTQNSLIDGSYCTLQAYICAAKWICCKNKIFNSQKEQRSSKMWSNLVLLIGLVGHSKRLTFFHLTFSKKSVSPDWRFLKIAIIR